MTKIRETSNMNKPRLYALCTSTALLAVILSTATAQDAALNGAQLFVAKACMACHGADGRTPMMPLYPKIAGQNAGYIYNQMRDIKNGSRNNGQTMIMKGIMANVSDKEVRAIADWLSAQ